MIAVVAGAAVVLVRPRSRPTMGGLVVVVGAVALVGAIAVPAAFGSPPLEPSASVAPPASVPLPPSTQLANACSWLTSVGSPLLLAIDSGDQRHLADYLVRVEDPLIRQFGAELRDSAAKPEGPVAMQVRAALINRCDDFRNTGH